MEKIRMCKMAEKCYTIVFRLGNFVDVFILNYIPYRLFMNSKVLSMMEFLLTPFSNNIAIVVTFHNTKTRMSWWGSNCCYFNTFLCATCCRSLSDSEKMMIIGDSYTSFCNSISIELWHFWFHHWVWWNIANIVHCWMPRSTGQ